MAESAPRRIGFIATEYYQPDKVGSWSGLPANMARALAQQGYEIVPLPVRASYNAPPEILQFGFWKLVGRRFLRDRTPRYLAQVAREVSDQLARVQVDALFAPSSLLISALPPGLPAYFWTDATFAGMVGFYASFSRLSPLSLRHGYEADQRALARCTAAFYASDWAAESARRVAPEHAEKVFTLPFGANLDRPPDTEEALRMIASRGSRIRLLFLGVDWERKGGPFALDVLRAWRKRGAEVELHVAGCEPPAAARSDPGLVCHGFISKASEGGARRLAELLASSHWLLLPSRAECFGVVFAEAAAYAVPSAATRVGGIPSAVLEGRSGVLFPVEASADEWAHALAEITSGDGYVPLSVSSRRVYEETLNWGVSARRLAERLNGRT